MLVAVAILGMALGALYQAAGTATRIVGVDEKYSYATELALSLLADNGEVPAAGLSLSGKTDGGFEWSVEAGPLLMAEPAPLKEGMLQEIAISVAWRDGVRERDIVLHSIVAGRENME
jgi:general secretion pathway protein I